MNRSINLYFNRLKKSSIAQNLISLGFFQLTNYLLPLLFIPYLIRTIGIDKFGQVSLSQAIMSILIVFTDFSFNLSSTRAISLNKSDKRKLSDIYSTTLFSKIALSLLAVVMLTACITVIPKLRENILLHFFGFFWVIGNVLFPVWLFQGLEKMQYITYLNLVSKVITFISIVTFINDPEDFIFVLPCYGLGLLISSIISIQIIKKRIGLKFSIPPISNIVKSLREGLPIFFGNLSITLYSSTTILILGAFSSSLYVGYYSVAEKVMLIPRQMLSVFSQAVFPQVCQRVEAGIHLLKDLWKKLLPFLYAIVIIFCLAIFILAHQITFLITGFHNSEIAFLIRCLSFVPVIVSFNIPSYLTLLAMDFKKECAKVLFPAAIFNISANAFLSHYFNAIGTSMALIATEIIVAVGLFLLTKMKVYGNVSE